MDRLVFLEGEKDTAWENLERETLEKLEVSIREELTASGEFGTDEEREALEQRITAKQEEVQGKDAQILQLTEAA